jgi:hypothetical protein
MPSGCRGATRDLRSPSLCAACARRADDRSGRQGRGAADFELEGELWHGARRPPIVVRHPELAQALRSVHSTLRLPAAALEQGEASAIVGCFVDDLTSSFRERSEPARDGHPAVQRARAYIHDRWREDFTLDVLALAAGLSPFHSPAASASRLACRRRPIGGLCASKPPSGSCAPAPTGPSGGRVWFLRPSSPEPPLQTRHRVTPGGIRWPLAVRGFVEGRQVAPRRVAVTSTAPEAAGNAASRTSFARWDCGLSIGLHHGKGDERVIVEYIRYKIDSSAPANSMRSTGAPARCSIRRHTAMVR